MLHVTACHTDIIFALRYLLLLYFAILLLSLIVSYFPLTSLIRRRYTYIMAWLRYLRYLRFHRFRSSLRYTRIAIISLNELLLFTFHAVTFRRFIRRHFFLLYWFHIAVYDDFLLLILFYLLSFFQRSRYFTLIEEPRRCAVRECI